MANGTESTSGQGNGTGADAVTAVPAAVLEQLGREIETAGGPWQEPQEYEGSIGRTMFDSPQSEDGTVTVLLPRDNIDKLCTQAMVRVTSVPDRQPFM
jgi:hypothetical protein